MADSERWVEWRHAGVTPWFAITLGMLTAFLAADIGFVIAIWGGLVGPEILYGLASLPGLLARGGAIVVALKMAKERSGRLLVGFHGPEIVMDRGGGERRFTVEHLDMIDIAYSRGSGSTAGPPRPELLVFRYDPPDGARQYPSIYYREDVHQVLTESYSKQVTDNAGWGRDRSKMLSDSWGVAFATTGFISTALISMLPAVFYLQDQWRYKQMTSEALPVAVIVGLFLVHVATWFSVPHHVAKGDKRRYLTGS